MPSYKVEDKRLFLRYFMQVSIIKSLASVSIINSRSVNNVQSWDWVLVFSFRHTSEKRKPWLL